MKKYIGLGILAIFISLFLFFQIQWQSIFGGNLILELGTHISPLDTIEVKFEVKFYVDDNLVLDTTYNTFEILVPVDLPQKKHSAYFVVNGNKSKIFTFCNYIFTFICVEYLQGQRYIEEEDYFEYDIGAYFFGIRVQKHPIRFIM